MVLIVPLIGNDCVPVCAMGDSEFVGEVAMREADDEVEAVMYPSVVEEALETTVELESDGDWGERMGGECDQVWWGRGVLCQGTLRDVSGRTFGRGDENSGRHPRGETSICSGGVRGQWSICDGRGRVRGGRGNGRWEVGHLRTARGGSRSGGVRRRRQFIRQVISEWYADFWNV
jgi:hypothetical protein